MQLKLAFLDPPDLAPNPSPAAPLATAWHLQRLFAEHLGTTIEKYVFSLRLDRGRELLRQSTLSVLAVAIASGFANASHFSRAYKAKFGKPPREARRALRPLLPRV
jgi:transcriptional regulator GlxA family with amidase domain